MGILDWLTQRFRGTEYAEITGKEDPTQHEIKPAAIRIDNTPALSPNRDFLYGMAFGTFKNDLDSIKTKLHSIHTDLSDNHSLILSSTDKNHQEILSLLGEHRQELGKLIDKTEKQLATQTVPAELAQTLKRNLEAAKLSLRQAEIYQIAQQTSQVTAKQIAKQLGIAENTATEHLRKLEQMGHLERKKRGVYLLTQND